MWKTTWKHHGNAQKIQFHIDLIKQKKIFLSISFQEFTLFSRQLKEKNEMKYFHHMNIEHALKLLSNRMFIIWIAFVEWVPSACARIFNA